MSARLPKERLEAFADLTQIPLKASRKSKVIKGHQRAVVELGSLKLPFTLSVVNARALKPDPDDDAAMVLRGPGDRFLLVVAYDAVNLVYLAYVVDAGLLKDPQPCKLLDGVKGITTLEEKIASGLRRMFQVEATAGNWEEVERA